MAAPGNFGSSAISMCFSTYEITLGANGSDQINLVASLRPKL